MKIDDKVRSFLVNINQASDSDEKLEEIRQLVRQRCKNDLWFFCYHSLEFADINNPLHKDMCRRWQTNKKKRYSLWLYPRGHLKTSLFSEGGLLHDFINDPNQRCLLLSAKMENAEDILKNIKSYVETRPIFRWLFPEYCYDLADPVKAKRAKWLSDRIDFPCSIYAGRKEGNILIAGIEMSVVSKHFDIIQGDDIVNDENVSTRQYRNKIDDKMKDILQLRHDPSTSIVRLIGTRWHEDDHYGRKIKQERAYRKSQLEKGEEVVPRYYINVRSIIEPVKEGQKGLEIVGRKNVLPIWPERYTPEVIEELRQENGSYVFSCQHMNDPVDPENAIFKREDIQEIDFFDIPELLTNFMAVDLAATDKDESDYTAITVASFDEGGNMYIREIVRKKLLPHDALEHIWRLQCRWKCNLVAIEGVVFQTVILKTYHERCMKEKWNIPFTELSRSSIRKFTRILGLQPLVENKRFYVESGIANFDALVEEMTGITADHLPAYDDILDTLADLFAIAYSAPKIVKIEKDPYSMDEWIKRAFPDENKVNSNRPQMDNLSRLMYG